MSLYRSPPFWAGLLGIFLLWSFPPTPASANVVRANSVGTAEMSIFSLLRQQSESAPTVLNTLAQANVVYLGETHDRPADHRTQLAILQALQQRQPNLAIAMEMFQRPYQFALDRYLAGDLSETELQERSQYNRRWGYPWEFYAPLLRFAIATKLPVIALNTPTEVTRKVARQGLDSLTLGDRRFVPPRSAILLAPDLYRQRLRQIYDDIHQGKNRSMDFERFFQAQVLWDETMAERIAQQLQRQPQTLVVVLVGQGHLLYGDGIPNRLARRLPRLPNGSPLVQYSVLLNPSEALQNQPGQAIADYFWTAP